MHQGIRPAIHRTPVLSSESIDRMAGAKVFFKCENFQKIGAFKMRGAYSAGLALTDAEKERGVATHSSGNHAQAVALTAQLHGLKAFIVMPKNSPAIKRSATAGYGAEIIFCDNDVESRRTTLEGVVAETGATFIHPFNDYNVIAGQATAAKELLEELPDLDMVMAPIGGGGLISGTALIVHYLNPDIRVIGTEPKEVDDAYRSLREGSIQTNTTINTIADGLRTNLGPKTFGIIQKYVNEIITVAENEIVEAMRIIWERMKIIVEPSGAVPLAALLQQRNQFTGQRVGIILTGGNVDVENLPF